MAEFRLSGRAERDLIEVYDYSEAVFGSYQAEAYLAGLHRTFDLLAAFPKMGRRVEEVALNFRRFRFQSHIVFYTEEPSWIVIRAVLHHARNVSSGLPDEGR